ncbi:Uma2 family endonuclease [Amycolatopsis jiangsuensis]|uniref:Uma2 family endonuclease n=1 Tax=Amycolatopsis jiangsuensis TaxID=1181879 RepID=A0A840J410_9PSEU|nr:Uma2 family endonuclease [Amycolatopsis jiangsuensis]MBB4688054.1 Uma2 family endonuclease [Amycolatopsis jiangsuensis]
MDVSTLPHRLLSITEYLALGEVEPGYTELVEGRLVFSPTPGAWHNHAAVQLALQLKGQLPAGHAVLLGLDLDLRLAPDGAPGFCRRPDLLVTTRSPARSVDGEAPVLRADEVPLVIEVVSAGSKRTDHVAKHREYADAGIPFYWILDLDEPISLVACHQAGELGYRDAPAVTGTFATAEPFRCEIDLPALLD